MTADDTMCLTMPEMKGGVVRSHLIGLLAQKRKLFVSGPLAADTDEHTVTRATSAINLFFGRLKSAKSRWDAGRVGGFCVNVGIRAMLLLFNALIAHAGTKRRNFDPTNAKPQEIVDEAVTVAKPLISFLGSISDQEFIERFGEKYGSGGPPEYFYELSQMIWESDAAFSPQGLLEYIASKDDRRVKEAEEAIKFIETRVTETIVSYFKRLHGDKYWNYLGTRDMRVKAYERQQEEPPEKQLDLEVYLDFVDKNKIIDKAENWAALKPYFDIPLPNEKGFAKNLKWMDKVNEMRRVMAHPHKKRTFKPDDLDLLTSIRRSFEEKLLAVGSQQSSLAE
jgi:DNA sulfur modification protein DndB